MQAAPDAVARPRSHDEVAALLAVCDARRIAVVPFGGGTSVVGGVEPDGGTDAATGRRRPVVAVDLARTAALLVLDEMSLLATFGAGTTGPQAEQLLAAHGLTLGHFPQSFEFASLGGYACDPLQRAGLARVRPVRRPGAPACGWPPRPASSTSGAPRAAPPGPICASCCWARRARSA
ncbi:FAD-binding oxidoreductase [Microbacterium elymi]|uniref:FAD-dependent oxidoreductase n=1 Tax=Microbacterium elymi TaxID=2909587 RepID=A0ABY5NKJ6_9MICO|nr:FAD-dependent oxidoreductase [Microbacterium elymi]UUT35689.1 FAD-dependent oxidoreductase [Microbacterium elymi]